MLQTARPSIINHYDNNGWVVSLYYDFGCGVIERTRVHRAYNRTNHSLRLVRGEWPDEDALLRWLGADTGYGTISISGSTAGVSIGGND